MNDNDNALRAHPREAAVANEEEPRFFFLDSARGPAIYHNPGPNRLRFPILFLFEDIAHAEAIGKKIAKILTDHWEDDR